MKESGGVKETGGEGEGKTKSRDGAGMPGACCSLVVSGEGVSANELHALLEAMQQMEPWGRWKRVR